jgi:hypothetical protein
MVLLGVTILGTFVGTLTAVEAKAWLPTISARLLRATVAHFPTELPTETRARWIEEIEADLGSLADRPFGGVLFALRLRLKGGRDLAAQLALDQAMGEMAPITLPEADEPMARPPVVDEAKSWRALLQILVERQVDALVEPWTEAERRRLLTQLLLLAWANPHGRARVSESPAMQRRFIRALLGLLAEEAW